MKKALLIGLVLIFASVGSALGTDCSLNCIHDCDYHVDADAKYFSVIGSDAPDLRTCFDVGDGLQIADMSGGANGQYRIMYITSVGQHDLYYQDADFPSNVTGTTDDIILKRIRPDYVIYNPDSNRVDWIWDRNGLYMMKGIDDIESVNGYPLLYLLTYDALNDKDQQPTAPVYGTFDHTDVQHHTVLAVHSVNNGQNSLMAAYVEAERHQNGTCSPNGPIDPETNEPIPNVNSFSHGMKVYYSDTSTCTNSPVYGRKTPVGLLGVGEIDTPDSNALKYEYLSGIEGNVVLKNGSSSAIGNAYAVKGKVSAHDGAITNAVSINALAHEDSTSNSYIDGSITNAIGVMVQKQTDGENNYGIVLDGDGEGSDVVFGSNKETKLYGNAGDFVIDTSGNVGIGASSPLSSLHLTDSRKNVYLLIQHTNQGGEYGIHFAGATIDDLNDPHIWIDHASPQTLRFWIAGNDRMVIENSGNIGIGTDTPQATLDVNGPIYQRGSQLYADYVFNVDYKLESIEAHSQYMWENKHLAAVPKALIDNDGKEIINVGSHRKGMLEELEKAHIYIEQLHKRLKVLEEKLAAIEKN